MKKRILSFFIIFTILICNFSVVAFADISSSPFDFILSFYASSMYDYNSVASDPDALIDFYDTDRGKLELLPFIPLTSAVGYCVARNSLEEASKGRYLVAQMSRDHLQAIYDSFNDYWASDSAPVRNRSLEEYNLTFSNNSIIHSGFGGIAGSGPAVTDRNVGEASERARCISFVPSGSLSSGNGDVYIYNGSLYFPPVIFVTTSGTVLHNNQTLDTGIYIVLNGSQLLMVDDSYFNYKWCLFYSSSDHVGQVGRYVYNDSGFSNINTIYKVIDNGSTLYADQYRYTPDFSYDDILELLSNSIGNHIVFDGEHVQPISFTIGDDVPFEDDDVVVMVPVDEPGEPVFMSPTTYNTYIDNGDIYNTDNTTNNIINDNSITNFMNIYNDYITNNNSSSSGYDDTNLMTKLDTIINKLSDIYTAIKNIDLSPSGLQQSYDSFMHPEPDYNNFSDCITDNVPIAGDIKTLVESMRVDEAHSGFDDNDFLAAIVTEESSVSSNSDIITSSFQNLTVNLGWYVPYRLPVRNILKIACYILGVVGIWNAVRSVFGVKSGGNG